MSFKYYLYVSGAEPGPTERLHTRRTGRGGFPRAVRCAPRRDVGRSHEVSL